MSDGLYYGGNGGVNMWDNYPVYQTKLKKEVNLGLAEAITSSILSTGRIAFTIDIEKIWLYNLLIKDSFFTIRASWPPKEVVRQYTTGAPHNLKEYVLLLSILLDF